MDHDYRVIAWKNNIEINVRDGDDLASFPIEKARFRSIWYVIGAGTFSMVGYGWSMQFRAVSCASTSPQKQFFWTTYS